MVSQSIMGFTAVRAASMNSSLSHRGTEIPFLQNSLGTTKPKI